MPDNKSEHTREPEGFTEHTRGPAAEKASEEGWGTDEEKRRKPPQPRPDHYGGKGYDYGAQDFGDTPEKRDNPSGTDDWPENKKSA